MRRSTSSPLALTAIAAGAALALGACTTGQPRAARIDGSWVQPDTSGRILYMQPVQPMARSVISKNYSVGSRRVATVGESMVGVRDYTSSDLVVAAIAAEDFVQHCRTPDQLKPDEIAAAAAAGRSQGADPRATAEVPAGGFVHEPEAYGAAGTSDTELQTAAEAHAAAQAEAAEEDRDEDGGVFAPFRRVFGRGDDDAKAAAGEAAAEPQYPDVVEEPVDPLACQSGRLSFVRGERGDRFAVAGAFEDGGKQYYLLDFPTIDGNLYLAVDARGRLKPDGYLAWRDLDEVVVTRFGVPLEYVKVRVPMDEDGRLFRFETTETVSVQGGVYRNFELVYKGTTYDHRGMVYHMLYKEYGRDRPTTPIFIQDLAYGSQTNTVDILGMRIRVHDVNDSQIIYTVQRD